MLYSDNLKSDRSSKIEKLLDVMLDILRSNELFLCALTNDTAVHVKFRIEMIKTSAPRAINRMEQA